jgi:hypothetical protein
MVLATDKSVKRATASALIAICGAVVLCAACASVIRTGKQAYFLVQSSVSSARVRIVLDRAFVDLYGDRVTIDTSFTVDRAGRFAHASYLDGDLHVAGRSAEIGLPVVAEVQNATLRPDVVEAIQGAAGSGAPVPLTGVWRIWSDQYGADEETQGRHLEPIERTNPPHVFEIHPVTCVDGRDLAGSLVPVRGFRPEPAGVVFRSLNASPFRIVPGERDVTLYARRREYNDADFVMQLTRQPQRVVSDGRFVRANVLGPRGDFLAGSIRMAFVRDTAPEIAVRALGPGDRLHVFGIPRLDLSEVAARLARAGQDPGALEGSLPYEIVVVGVFRDPRRSEPGRGTVGLH